MRFICICGCICALLPCGPNSICGFAKVHLWWRVGCICGFFVVHLWLGPLCTCAPVHLVRHTGARAWGEVVPTPGSTNLWLARGAPVHTPGFTGHKPSRGARTTAPGHNTPGLAPYCPQCQPPTPLTWLLVCKLLHRLSGPAPDSDQLAKSLKNLFDQSDP